MVCLLGFLMVLLYTSLILFQLGGGGQGHALSEFSNEFFKPFHYRMAGSIQSDLDQPNLSLTYW